MPNTRIADNLKFGWETANVRYKNFTDLGQYVLLLDEVTECNLDDVIRTGQKMYPGNNIACTAAAKRNRAGEMLVGRNMDIEINQMPVVIVPWSFGKHKAIGIDYMFSGSWTYREMLADGAIDEEYFPTIPYCITDCMNDKGLFIEANMREADSRFRLEHTNPGNKRLPITFLPTLLSSYCATVAECLEYIKDGYDYYTPVISDELRGSTYAYLLADATGNYGILECVNNRFYFLPYQNGQSNYYLNGDVNAIEIYGSGYGRLKYVVEGLEPAETKEDMLKLMSGAYFSEEIMYLENSYRDEKGALHFEDNMGNPMPDWRSDYNRCLYVDDVGNCSAAAPADDAQAAVQLDRCTTAYVMTDANFEKVRAAAIDYRKTDRELLRRYYAGNEDPLRDKGDIWTTSLSFGVNCTRKEFVLKINERDDLILNFGW